jgi:curved DNA-binding protein CbpA
MTFLLSLLMMVTVLELHCDDTRFVLSLAPQMNAIHGGRRSVVVSSECQVQRQFAGYLVRRHQVATNSDNSNNGSDDAGRIRKSRRKPQEERTLYDILGASPRDSQEQLKVRYTAIVKALHPDINPRTAESPYGGGTNLYYDLGEVNAAWEILKDKKQRLRYDRSLQAKEFTEGVEAFVSVGIKTAIPWLQKTADTTVAAVDASARAAQEGAEQAKLAYGIFELDQQARALEQKAAREISKALRLEKELKALPAKKIASLEKQNYRKQTLTSSDAERILSGFQISNEPATRPPTGLLNDLNSFTASEQDFRESVRGRQAAELSALAATRTLEQAAKAEELALKRLEEAQRNLELAMKNVAMAKNSVQQAKLDEQKLQQSLIKTEATLEKTKEKVRVGLLQQQDLFMDKQAKRLKREIEECELQAKNFQTEANKLRKAANFSL